MVQPCARGQPQLRCHGVSVCCVCVGRGAWVYSVCWRGCHGVLQGEEWLRSL